MRAVFIFLLSICSLTGSTQIKIDAEKDVDVRKFQTFSIQKGQVIYQSNEKKKDENKIFQVLKEALTKELITRGYQPADDSVAELSVSYVYQESRVSMGGNPGPFGQTPIDNPANIDVNETSATVNTGTLILEVEQVKNKNSLWTATCTISRVQQNFGKTLEATVIAAFKKFPSKNKKK